VVNEAIVPSAAEAVPLQLIHLWPAEAAALPRSETSLGMRKGGLRRLFCLYFYFTKLDTFTAPGFEIYYHEPNQQVTGKLMVLGA
jgi:hypothetical protein